MKRGENEATPRRVTGGCFDKCAFRDQGETLLFVQVDGVLLVVRAAELDLDVAVQLGAVQLDVAVGVLLAGEPGHLDGAGVGQLVGMAVQDITVHPVGQLLGIILCHQLLDQRCGILFQVIDVRRVGAGHGTKDDQRPGSKKQFLHKYKRN